MASSADVMDIIDRMNTVMPVKYLQLKAKQTASILESGKNDVLTVLPTGYGKTVIIQALPFLTEVSRCIVVVNALNGIIEEQKARFGERCIVLTENIVKYLDDETDVPLPDPKITKVVDRLRNRDETLNYILCHPEVIVQPSVKKVLISYLSDRITHIVIDEAHCVLSWGNSSFRPAYQKLGLLRAILPNIFVHALTATATKTSQQNIITSLRMKEPRIILESPDRPNVFLEVKTRPPSTGGEHTAEDAMYEVVDPILEELKNKGHNFEKTIIYVPLKWCGQLHYRAEYDFNITSNTNSDPALQNIDTKLTAAVSQYHSPQSQNMKSLIVKNMQEKDGSLRLLFATEAYGMGIDVEDIYHVIHVGPPNNVETFVQEIGRCGRNGKEAKATLYFNKKDIASNNTHLDEQMKMYCTTESCRRKLILEYFGFKTNSEIHKHNCCDNCTKICSCDECKLQQRSGAQIHDVDMPNAKKINLAKEMLAEYFVAENKCIKNTLLPETSTGLSCSLADKLSKKYENIGKDEILYEFPLLTDSYATNISKILSAVNSMKI